MTKAMVEEVATVGMPVRNECASAHLNLFIDKVHSSGVGDNLGLVDSGFGDVERCVLPTREFGRF